MHPYEYQNAANVGAQTAPPRTTLEDFTDRLGSILMTISEISDITDRACGTQGIGESNSVPKPVPNGELDRISMDIATISDRLVSLRARLVGRIG